MIYCTKCGKAFPDTAKFCSACGNSLKKPVTIPVIAEEVLPTEETAIPAEPVVTEEVISIPAEPAVTEEVNDTQKTVFAEDVNNTEKTVFAEDVNDTEEPVITGDFNVSEEPSALPVEGDVAVQQGILDTMYRLLKYRRLACKIIGIFSLIFGLFYAVFAGIYIAGAVTLSSGNVYIPEYPHFFFILYSILYICYALVYLANSFINFGMKKKAEKLMDEMYHNVRPAADYCASIGRIVVAYFFNHIAMVFAIIGCVHARRNAEEINRIERNQSLFR